MLKRAGTYFRGFNSSWHNVQTRLLATQVEAAKIDTTHYANAIPYSNIPGPSAVSLVLSNFPGGKLYQKDLGEIIRICRKKYGDFLKLPGVFGSPDIIFSHIPDHFQTIFRTEGPWPSRSTMETIRYFRKEIRPDIFGKYEGLFNSQDQEWSEFRKAVNPVLIQPKAAKLYIPAIDAVTSDFLNRIRNIRHSTTNQLPENFEDELNHWTLESTCVIAMDTRLGLISDKHDARAAKCIGAVKNFFELIPELEFKPSIWKIVSTPKFRKLMKALNTIATLSSEYVDEAKERLEKRSAGSGDGHEQSVLEKLLKIDPLIAKVMAMDMIFAGVDTVDPLTVSFSQEEYSKAAPYSSIPGPSATSFVLANLPGGKFYKMELKRVISSCRNQYGDIVKFPGVFDNPDAIITHDPNHFQIMFRTEGLWPMRNGFQTMEYFREKVRPDIFGVHQGLLNSEGKKWGDFRKAVNPVMIQPKTTKLYIPVIDQVTNDFLERIRKIRSPTTNQLPEDFEDELNKWALESIGVIGLDTRLGLISDKYNERAAKLIESVKSFFELVFELEFKPSIWKLIRTPTFRKLMQTLNTLTDLSSQYIDEAKERLEKKSTDSSTEHEQSVLEKLLKIDPIIAKVMAMDMLFAGVDTTSSAFTSVCYLLAKNPEKQEILRKEVMAVLPEKHSAFTIETMNRLPYLRGCIKESQRLLPTVNGNLRCAGQDLVLSGYQIPKGTQVIMNSPPLQLNDQHFPEATKFLPERWLKQQGSQANCPASAKSAHPFIYLPFGFGPRMCIGRRFAEMEVEILISKMVRNFYLGWEHPDLKYKWKALNVPDGKLMFTLVDVNK